jgi:hypothetical protein
MVKIWGDTHLYGVGATTHVHIKHYGLKLGNHLIIICITASRETPPQGDVQPIWKIVQGNTFGPPLQESKALLWHTHSIPSKTLLWHTHSVTSPFSLALKERFQKIGPTLLKYLSFEKLSFDLDLLSPSFEKLSFDLDLLNPSFENVLLDLDLLNPSFEKLSFDLHFFKTLLLRCCRSTLIFQTLLL